MCLLFLTLQQQYSVPRKTTFGLFLFVVPLLCADITHVQERLDFTHRHTSTWDLLSFLLPNIPSFSSEQQQQHETHCDVISVPTRVCRRIPHRSLKTQTSHGTEPVRNRRGIKTESPVSKSTGNEHVLYFTESHHLVSCSQEHCWCFTNEWLQTNQTLISAAGDLTTPDEGHG